MEINEKATLNMNKAYWSMNNWIHKKNDDKNNQYINIPTSKINSSDTLCGQLTVGLLKFLGHQNNAVSVLDRKTVTDDKAIHTRTIGSLESTFANFPGGASPSWPFFLDF